MSKNRHNLPPQRDPPGPPRRGTGRPGPGIRVLVSLFLLWHLAALFMAPLSVPGSSELATVVAQGRPMQWYLDALHLNHGYHFFAPDPPPGYLIRYEWMDSQGNATVGEFPNKKDYWPRLRYHRYFMLADQAVFPSSDENVRNEWTRKYLTAYARHLLREHDAERVRIQRVIHIVLPPPMARRLEEQEIKLDDPSTYEVQMEVVQFRRDLELDEAERATQSSLERRDAAAGWTSGGVR